MQFIGFQLNTFQEIPILLAPKSEQSLRTGKNLITFGRNGEV